MRKTLLCLLAISLGGPAFGADDVPKQFWKSDTDGWVVETRPCDGGLCADLVAYKMVHQHPPGFVPTDVKNPSAARRDTPLCGLQLIGGFKRSTRKDGVWDGGWIYDPDSGHTYSGTITQLDADTVKLRGYVGISLFGRTLILHRLADVPARCAPSPTSP
jgi:uncharacterized protein (DUF2147 family)